MTPNLPDDLITPRQAARLLGVHPATVYRYLRVGRLACWVRAGTRKFVSQAAVRGLFTPPAVAPLPSHAEAVAALRKNGFHFEEHPL